MAKKKKKEAKAWKPVNDAMRIETDELINRIKQFSYEDCIKSYHELAKYEKDGILHPYVVAELGRRDRFFLLTQILRRPDILHPWLYARCREVEKSPDGFLDLWAREHYKSTLITFGGIIQEVLNNPNITIGIFAFNKPAAKTFLGQIRQEFQENDALRYYYPDIFFENPKKDSQSWSLDAGICVKRQDNRKEMTIEAWGLIDGQPIGRHFQLVVYDDVVTKDNATSNMIPKTTEAWELSLSLSAKSGEDAESTKRRFWYVGTFYDFRDTYSVIIERRAAIPRKYSATDTGTKDGKPVFMSTEEWEEVKTTRGPKTLNCQYLLNPVAGSEQPFKIEYVRYYELRPRTLNVAICVDPASSKGDNACNSAFAVIGIDRSRNKYLLDGACHRMSLSERWTMLKNLYWKWVSMPGIQLVKVGYEQYGLQCDREHFEEMMKIEEKYFAVDAVNWPRSSKDSHEKDLRIERLLPDHHNWRWFYPYNTKKYGETKNQAKAYANGDKDLISRAITRKNHEGHIYDLVQWFIENEYLFFPATTLKDFFDAMSRFYDVGLPPPITIDDNQLLVDMTDG